LTCEIINWGDPKAIIAWKRSDRQYLSSDLIIVNETHTSLKLSNITEPDAGVYMCEADVIFNRRERVLYLVLQGIFYIWQAFM